MNDTKENTIEQQAREVIIVCSEIQNREERDSQFNGICLRCGHARMISGIARNALSRHFDDTFVCPPCGNDEALRVWKDIVLPPEMWWICKEILP
jgi:predicted RNA-binding Zn-ribbon protein involved in translation (DUF1610 family)